MRPLSRALGDWLPSPLLKASAALHLGAFGLVAVSPGRWRWALAAVAADHLLMAGASLMPRSSLLGPTLTRLPDAARRRGEVALTFDDGPDPAVTPRVLDLLDEAGARASFFVVGRRAAAAPELVAEMGRRGHKLENHTWSHAWTFALRGPRGLAREVARAQEAIAELAGRRPAWFRPPAGMRTPLLAGVLAGQGLELASWTRRGLDTVSRAPERIAGRLLRGLAAGDVLLLHDGGLAAAAARPPVLEVLPRLLEALDRRGLRGVALPDPEGPAR